MPEKQKQSPQGIFTSPTHSPFALQLYILDAVLLNVIPVIEPRGVCQVNQQTHLHLEGRHFLKEMDLHTGSSSWAKCSAKGENRPEFCISPPTPNTFLTLSFSTVNIIKSLKCSKGLNDFTSATDTLGTETLSVSPDTGKLGKEKEKRAGPDWGK